LKTIASEYICIDIALAVYLNNKLIVLKTVVVILLGHCCEDWIYLFYVYWKYTYIKQSNLSIKTSQGRKPKQSNLSIKTSQGRKPKLLYI